MKWVPQMPHPAAAPAVTSQAARTPACVERARWNRLMAVTLARKQTIPARTTSRKSCSVERQLNTRNIFLGAYPCRSTELARNGQFEVKATKVAQIIVKQPFPNGMCIWRAGFKAALVQQRLS